MKATLARGALADVQLFDDFGVAVSNDAAKSAAAGFACLLKQSERIRPLKRVVATSFGEVAPFLGVDWALHLDTNALVVRSTFTNTTVPRHHKIIIENDTIPLTLLNNTHSTPIRVDTPHGDHEGDPEKPTQKDFQKKEKRLSEVPAPETAILTASVDLDAYTKHTAAALAFDGTSTTSTHAIPKAIFERARVISHTREKENVQGAGADAEKKTKTKKPLSMLLISGRSGSGKSTSAAQAFGSCSTWIPPDYVRFQGTTLAEVRKLGFDELGLARTPEALIDADQNTLSTCERYLVTLALDLRPNCILEEFLTALPQAMAVQVVKAVGEYVRFHEMKAVVALSCGGENI